MTNVVLRIANTLKSLRKESGWSLDVASQHTGVSKAMLGQIERGESSPTIATLWKIATGFNTSFSSLLDVAPEEGAQSDAKRNLKQLCADDDKIRVMPIIPFDDQLLFEVFLIELLPGCEHISLPHQENIVEHVVAICGELEVLVNRKWHTVKENSGLKFNANQQHGYRNTTEHKVILHNIIHYPRKQGWQ